jgi:hypothetical protein
LLLSSQGSRLALFNVFFAKVFGRQRSFYEKNEGGTKMTQKIFSLIASMGAMKTSRHFFVFYILFAAVFSLIGCATTPEKPAIKDAENIDFDPVPPSPIGDIERLCYIICKGNSQIIGFDYFNTKPTERMVIFPGVRLLTVQYFISRINQNIVTDPQGRRGTQTTTYQVKSEPIPLSFTFDEGKYYYLDYEITRGAAIFDSSTIQFSIAEIKEPALHEEARKGLADYEANYIAAVENYQTSVEKLNNFLAFSKANPHYIQGAWTYSRSYPWEDIEITFGADNRFVTASFNRMSKNQFTTEGVYHFNENIIILNYEKQQGENVSQKEIINYELKDGILYIKSGGNAAIVTAGGLKGNYEKK